MRVQAWHWAAVGVTVAVGLGPTAPVQAASAVDIRNFVFSPDAVRIERGDSVQWKNRDGYTHTVTAPDPRFAEDGDDAGDDDVETFDSGLLGPEDAYTHTFRKVGTFHYRCELHWWMVGTVEVVPRPTTTTKPPATAKPTTTTKPTTTSKPTTTTTQRSGGGRPTATTGPKDSPGPSPAVAPPPAATTTAPPPTTTTTGAGALAPVPPAPGAGVPAVRSPQPTSSPPTRAPRSAPGPSSSSTSPGPPPSASNATPAPDPAAATPGPPVPVEADPSTPPPADAGQAAENELARGLPAAPPEETGRSGGMSPTLKLLLGALVGVGLFGAWSLVQMRPGRTGM